MHIRRTPTGDSPLSVTGSGVNNEYVLNDPEPAENEYGVSELDYGHVTAGSVATGHQYVSSETPEHIMTPDGDLYAIVNNKSVESQ